MKFDIYLRAGLLALGIGTLSGMANALPITGNPVADGWSWQGNSLAPGTYIRGTGGWSFGVYNQVFTLDVTDGNWQTGDQIIGLGGVTSGQYIFWPNVVAKFGSSTASFSASSLLSPNGDGNGSFSSGMAGLGGVQVDFHFKFDDGVGIQPGTHSTTTVRPGLANTVLLPDHVLYTSAIGSFLGFPFAVTPDINPDFARVIGLFSPDGSGQDILDSFEIVLNLSYLDREVAGPLPQVNGKSDMAVQRFYDDFSTDALVNPDCTGTDPRVCTPPAPQVVAGGYQYDFDVTASGGGKVYIPLLDPSASYDLLIGPDGQAQIALITDPNFVPDNWITVSDLLAMGKDPAFADPAAWLEITEKGDKSFVLRITSSSAPTLGPIMVDGRIIDPPVPGRPDLGSSVPEPGTLALASIALVSLALARRRRSS